MDENKLTTTCNKYGGMISKLFSQQSFYGPLAPTNLSSELGFFYPTVLKYASSFDSPSFCVVNVLFFAKLLFLTDTEALNGIYKDHPFYDNYGNMVSTNTILLQIRYDIA